MADVFISYSRKDADFVRRLGEALVAAEREAWLDWKDIPLTVEWQQEIDVNIDACDSFLFIISPDSIASANCTREFERAVAMHKRVLPILYRSVPDEAVPPVLGKFQRIGFDSPDLFDERVAALLQALDTDLAWVKAHTRLLTRALEWLRTDSETSLLLRGKELTEAETWSSQASEKEPQPTMLQSQYILASRQAAVRLQRLVTGAVAAALAIAIALAIYAFWQQSVAERKQRESRARELSAVAIQGLAQDPERSLIVAMHAVQATRTHGEAVLPAAAQALDMAVMASLVRQTLIGHADVVHAVAYSPDGTRLASAAGRGEIMLWDAASGRMQMRLQAQHGNAFAVAFSADGAQVAAGFQGGEVAVWNAADGRPWPVIDSGTGSVESLAFGAEGKQISIAGTKGVAIWNAADGVQLVPAPPLKGGVASAAVSADGQHFAMAGESQILLVDASGQRRLEIGSREITSMAFSRDAGRLAVGDGAGRVTVWNTSTGKMLLTAGGETGSVRSLAFSSDGSRLASGSRDGAVSGSARVWDLTSGRQLLVMKGHVGAVLGLAFSPDGSRLATASTDRAVKVWEAAAQSEWLTLGRASGGAGRRAGSLAYSGNGKWLASLDDCGRLRLWDTDLGRGMTPTDSGACVDSARANIASIGLNGDGTLVATTDANQSTQVWHVGQAAALAGDWRAGAYGVAISDDGSRLATNQMQASVWDIPSGKKLVTVAGHSGFSQGVALSRDGTRLATIGPKKEHVEIWDAASGQPLLRLSDPQASGSNALAFSRDGRRLAAVGKSAVVWDVGSGKVVRSWDPLPGKLYAAALSDDGARLATLGWNRTAQVWDVASGQSLLSMNDPAPKDAMASLAFSPVNGRLAIAWTDGGVQVVTVEIDDLLALARSRVTRDLTAEECFLSFQVKQCPALPASALSR